MRGAFETFLIFFLGMTFVLLGFSMVEVILNYNQARLYQETIVSLIERHNRYDSEVVELIKDSNKYCKNCVYSVTSDYDKFLVNVDFDIMISVINFRKKASIKSLTQSIK